MSEEHLSCLEKMCKTLIAGLRPHEIIVAETICLDGYLKENVEGRLAQVACYHILSCQAESGIPWPQVIFIE